MYPKLIYGSCVGTIQIIIFAHLSKNMEIQEMKYSNSFYANFNNTNSHSLHYESKIPSLTRIPLHVLLIVSTYLTQNLVNLSQLVYLVKTSVHEK